MVTWTRSRAVGQRFVTVRFGWKDGRHGGSGESAFRLVSGRMECVGVRLGDIGADHVPAYGVLCLRTCSGTFHGAR